MHTFFLLLVPQDKLLYQAIHFQPQAELTPYLSLGTPTKLYILQEFELYLEKSKRAL